VCGSCFGEVWTVDKCEIIFVVGSLGRWLQNRGIIWAKKEINKEWVAIVW